MPDRTECPGHGFNFLQWAELVSLVLFPGNVLNYRKDILDKNVVNIYMGTQTLCISAYVL